MNPLHLPGNETGALDREAYRVAYLIAGYLRGTLTPGEHDELDRWVEESDRHMRLFEELTDEEATPATLQWADRLHGSRPLPLTPRRGVLLRMGRYRLAKLAVAAAVLLTLLALWWLPRSTPSMPEAGVLAAAPTSPSGAAGRITLRLQDGTTVALPDHDSTLVLGDGSRLTTSAEGVSYGSLQDAAVPPSLHRLQVPAGRTCRLQLGDGSRVWLNTASTLTYPVAFTGGNRSVTLQGEGYFEVASNRARPFRVAIGGITLQVLGTAFNVEGYTPPVTTTLVEGRLKVVGPGDSALLSPGGQVRAQAGGRWQKSARGDVERALAWQSGLFLFREAPLAAVGAELARWYGVEVEVEDTLSHLFTATLPRTLPLPRVLSVLELTGKVRCTLQGRSLRLQAIKPASIP